MTDVSHYRKRPFYVAKMTENGIFLSQTAFFSGKCDSGMRKTDATPCNNPSRPSVLVV